ncbi:AAA family ATPase [Chryseobacterium sp.]|uniref:AAA family ATPase n=1 Tax=Chryseobacterium sp. TaxID=1871047 RepID=UPI0011C8CB7E|nr:AAA family ATPase [Chryseobacterium sp.]TXF78843.1 AAA family ATPase [Chryseobacterium sp.]
MNNLKKFSIRNLFGYQNINLVFNDDKLILMGENGLGKTSILNSIYFTLTKKWNKLLKINFESIYIKFDDNIEFEFSKEQLSSYIQYFNKKTEYRFGGLKSEIINKFNPDDLTEFLKEKNYYENFYSSKVDRHRIILEYVRKSKFHKEFESPIPLGLAVELIDQIYKNNNYQSLIDLINYIDNSFSKNILYFPTYRRVEEELHNLGKIRKVASDELKIFWDEDEKEETEELEEETLIQFGMEDVVKRIQSIIAEINESSVKGFSRVSAEILHQLQEGFPIMTKSELLDINRNNIEIILNRVKNNLSSTDRENILKLLESGEIVEKQELAYFLIKLENIYLQQRELDNSIKVFERICNEYLVGKRFIFDESNVTLYIYNNITDDRVELNQLSSGEKQIVSLFSKIYLEEKNDFLVFFDEPELSLSIKWQKQLLPHILESKKCSFLLAVTHSPFIFSNYLEEYTVGLNVFID